MQIKKVGFLCFRDTKKYQLTNMTVYYKIIVIVNIYRKKFGIWLQTYLHESFIFNNIYILILEKPFGLFKSFQ